MEYLTNTGNYRKVKEKLLKNPAIFILILLFIFGCRKTMPPDIEKNWDTEGGKITFVSQFTNKESYFLVFYPESAEPPLPVLYVLGGSGDDPHHWDIVADLQSLADRYKIMIVSISSSSHLYVDIENTDDKYESYVLEIISMVDNRYNTAKSKYLRGIGGFSLGGFGALYLAGKHPDLFMSVSVMSGGIFPDFEPDYSSLVNMDILMEVGIEDEFIADVRQAHEILLENEVRHEYRELPGGHDWEFRIARSDDHIKFHYENFRKYY
ncbi:alpha/beta hydrolase [candidate division KSB1 bacterium]